MMMVLVVSVPTIKLWIGNKSLPLPSHFSRLLDESNYVNQAVVSAERQSAAASFET